MTDVYTPGAGWQLAPRSPMPADRGAAETYTGRAGRRRGGNRSRAPIRIEGLREFQRDLADADKQLRRDFNKVLRTAADPIVRDARKFYYAGHNLGAGFAGYTRRTGRSVSGIKSGTHFGGVAVVLDGGPKKYRHLLGQEWGSYVHPERFGAPRGRWHSPDVNPGDSGSFFWPAYRRGVNKATDDVLDALDRAVRTLSGRNRGAARLASHVNVLGSGA